GQEWLILLEHVLVMAIGLAAGMFGGMLGVGGSVIMIPAMTLLFGPAQQLYQGAAMIMNFFVSLPSAWQHRRQHATLTPILLVTIPCAVVGVIVGVWTSSGPWFHGHNEVHLSRIFGGFLFYVAAYNIYRAVSRKRLPNMDAEAASRLPRWKIAAAVGLPTGFVGGLLGVGGGIIAVPMQQLFLRVPLHQAIANSAVTIVPLSLLGAFYKNYTNAAAGVPLADSLRLALFLIPTAMIGGFLGARFTHLMPRRLLRAAFIILMLYAGYALLSRPVPVIPSPAVAATAPVDSARE
ncbi:MAG TPA: sulfite exporter TauE/SafE family protein, partial [Phycisphaerae bacterium]|nr:sulfite exporter TauE/SafE family protein [Phycisphaerae bacterium]